MNITEPLRAALTGRYEVEHELGRGGMAVVFLGRDLRLERRVAIKVFEHEGRSGPVVDRFLREIRIAARLQHPNILPVHDSGQAEGLVYYVMPYVAGATLRERLEREGPLPIAEAVRIGCEVARALDHAHREGVVHRDIKPDNIMLESGVAVVADFGIARALEQGGKKLTDTGLAVGTPNYMSPEQATAQPHVDGRADIYALGCVLYEMLAGTPPFTGPTAQAVMARHTADAVPPLSTVRAVPPAVEATVVKALAKAPADRWQTGRAFAEALEKSGGVESGERGARKRTWVRVAIGAAAALGVAAAAWLGTERMRDEERTGRPEVPSVAVMGFEDRSRDPATAFLAEGITEALITRLQRVERLRVTTRHDARRLSERRVTDPAQAARALGTRFVVSGVVRPSGPRITVTVDLVDATGRQVWGDRFERDTLRLFELEEAIARDIAERVVGRLIADERRGLAIAPSRSPQAYLHYRRGNYQLAQRTEEAFRLALREFQSAIAMEPGFAAAHARLAYAVAISKHWPWTVPGVSRDSLRRRAEAAADRALSLDPMDSDAWLARGYLAASGPNVGAARGALERAVALDPSSVEAWHQLGSVVMMFLGDDSAASRAFERALALDPGYKVTLLEYSRLMVVQRRVEDALRLLDSLVAGYPTEGYLQTRAQLHLLRGDTVAARQDNERDRTIRSFPAQLYIPVRIAAVRGDTADARRLLPSWLGDFSPASPGFTLQGFVENRLPTLLAVGWRELVLEYLEAMAPDPTLAFWLRWPTCDPLRQEPRFQRLADEARRALDRVRSR